MGEKEIERMDREEDMKREKNRGREGEEIQQKGKGINIKRREKEGKTIKSSKKKKDQIGRAHAETQAQGQIVLPPVREKKTIITHSFTLQSPQSGPP